MKKYILLSALVITSTNAFSYTKPFRLLPTLGSKEWDQQEYEEEVERKQKEQERKIEEQEQRLEELEKRQKKEERKERYGY